MLERMCKKCDQPLEWEECPNCHGKTEISTTIYWSADHNIPIYEKYYQSEIDDGCIKEGNYIATNIRPVFPEENMLISILISGEPLKYQKSSIWATGNVYIIDGKKVKLSITRINKKPIEEILKLKKLYDEHSAQIDYKYFDEYISKFIELNSDHLSDIVQEARDEHIQPYLDRYNLEDMYVSFSGGKDSTVVSHMVRTALGTNKVLHIFGDTTLEFPFTLEYVRRFKKRDIENEANGVRLLNAKNYEKNFEDLCKVVGPPSRVMRWCCTVFKTGVIQKTIYSAFRNKTNILSFQGIRHNESVSRSKYERESQSPKITKQTVSAPIIDWIDFDIWLYILATKIDFNDAYRLGWTRVGCWCCPNNGAWSEFLSKFYLYTEYYKPWYENLVTFAKEIGKLDPEDYVAEGGWKARQGGNGLAAAQNSVVSFEPCATEENAFNYELQRPINEELYELFKPFGYINTELGNKRLGEVYVMNRKGKVLLVLQGRIGNTKLKVTIKDYHIAGAKTLATAEGKIQCQLTKYQMCLACKACESVCKHDAISVKDNGNGIITYTVNDDKCIRCSECVGHFNAGCYMRKVLGIKRT